MEFLCKQTLPIPFVPYFECKIENINEKWSECKMKKKQNAARSLRVFRFKLRTKYNWWFNAKIIASVHCHYGAPFWFVSFYTSSYFCWNDFVFIPNRFGRRIKWIVTQCIYALRVYIVSNVHCINFQALSIICRIICILNKYIQNPSEQNEQQQQKINHFGSSFIP